MLLFSFGAEFSKLVFIFKSIFIYQAIDQKIFALSPMLELRLTRVDEMQGTRQVFGIARGDRVHKKPAADNRSQVPTFRHES